MPPEEIAPDRRRGLDERAGRASEKAMVAGGIRAGDLERTWRPCQSQCRSGKNLPARHSRAVPPWPHTPHKDRRRQGSAHGQATPSAYASACHRGNAAARTPRRADLGHRGQALCGRSASRRAYPAIPAPRIARIGRSYVPVANRGARWFGLPVLRRAAAGGKALLRGALCACLSADGRRHAFRMRAAVGSCRGGAASIPGRSRRAGLLPNTHAAGEGRWAIERDKFL